MDRTATSSPASASASTSASSPSPGLVERLRASIAQQGLAVKEAKAEAEARGRKPNDFAKDEIDKLLALKEELRAIEEGGQAASNGSIPPLRAGAGGGGEFFSKPAFLTVSGQLEAEAYACSVRDVYTFGPTFRAENSNTSRHLSEFWMLEPELAFAGLDDVIACSQAYIKHCLETVAEENADDLAFFAKHYGGGGGAGGSLVGRLLESPWHRITYTEAVAALSSAVRRGEAAFEYPVQWGLDLQTEHERFLTEKVFGGCPVYVTDYPKDFKAFYMRRNDDGKTVAAVDLLVPHIGELLGGSEREERLGVLQQTMRDQGLAEDAMGWYKDLRRYGSVPHAGFGLGFERFVQLVTGLDNIRDVIPFPRYPGHAEF